MQHHDLLAWFVFVCMLISTGAVYYSEQREKQELYVAHPIVRKMLRENASWGKIAAQVQDSKSTSRVT